MNKTSSYIVHAINYSEHMAMGLGHSTSVAGVPELKPVKDRTQ